MSYFRSISLIISLWCLKWMIFFSDWFCDWDEGWRRRLLTLIRNEFIHLVKVFFWMCSRSSCRTLMRPCSNLSTSSRCDIFSDSWPNQSPSNRFLSIYLSIDGPNSTGALLLSPYLSRSNQKTANKKITKLVIDSTVCNLIRFLKKLLLNIIFFVQFNTGQF